jgi:hypothetical protein
MRTRLESLSRRSDDWSKEAGLLVCVRAHRKCAPYCTARSALQELRLPGPRLELSSIEQKAALCNKMQFGRCANNTAHWTVFIPTLDMHICTLRLRNLEYKNRRCWHSNFSGRDGWRKWCLIERWRSGHDVDVLTTASAIYRGSHWSPVDSALQLFPRPICPLWYACPSYRCLPK